MAASDAPSPTDVRLTRSMLADWAFRAFVTLITLVAVPHFVWVWQAEARLSKMEMRVSDNSESLARVELLAEQAKDKGAALDADLGVMKRDLTYLREGIDDLRARLPYRPSGGSYAR